jgi:hypothetical protein
VVDEKGKLAAVSPKDTNTLALKTLNEMGSGQQSLQWA